MAAAEPTANAESAADRLLKSNERIREVLGQPSSWDFHDTPLGDVARRLAEKHGIRIGLDLAALTADGRGEETPITHKFDQGMLNSGLRQFLDVYGLAYVVENEQLLVTTKTAAETKTSTRVYPVADLVGMPNDPALLSPDFESLIELITSSVAPESWESNYDIRAYRGPGTAVLVIPQTEDVHDRIAELLAAVRKLRDPRLAERQAKLPVSPRANSYYPGWGAYVTYQDPDYPPIVPTKVDSAVASVNKLASDLYREFAAAEPKNFVVSPYGTAKSLALLHAGAAGPTADEIRRALQFEDPPERFHEQMRELRVWLTSPTVQRNYEFRADVRLLVRNDARLNLEFLRRSIDGYDVTPEPIDAQKSPTAAGDRARRADREKTRLQLPTVPIAADIPAGAPLWIGDTSSFRGLWINRFRPFETLWEPFHAPSGKLNVEMMRQFETLRYAEVDGVQIVAKRMLTYHATSTTSMVVLLPPDRKDGLQTVEQMLARGEWPRLAAELRERSIDFYLPRFTIDTIHDHRPILEKLGVRSAFDPRAADFSRLDGATPSASDPRSHLAGCRRRVRISIDEEEVFVTEESVGQREPNGFQDREAAGEPVTVRCDRPFVFLIRDEATDCILLMGRVVEPDNNPKATLAPFPPRGNASFFQKRMQSGGGFF